MSNLKTKKTHFQQDDKIFDSPRSQTMTYCMRNIVAHNKSRHDVEWLITCHVYLYFSSQMHVMDSRRIYLRFKMHHEQQIGLYMDEVDYGNREGQQMTLSDKDTCSHTRRELIAVIYISLIRADFSTTGIEQTKYMVYTCVDHFVVKSSGRCYLKKNSCFKM